jgi:hypothetical protein
MNASSATHVLFIDEKKKKSFSSSIYNEEHIYQL